MKKSQVCELVIMHDHVVSHVYNLLDEDLNVDHVWPVPGSPTDAKCFNLARTWINQCTTHVGCRDTTSVILHKRVITTLEDPTLPSRLHIANNDSGQYVILSHCWGKTGLAKLKNPLVAKFQDGIDLKLLPKSFRDAINITRHLGFQYLWIDALCIIQDNAEDWEQEAAKMTSYYGQSMLIISATAAEDSSKGILTNREVIYLPVMGKQMKYCLRQRLLRWTYDITHPVLHIRGWAFQERMFAPRILHYTRRQMIWECANGFKLKPQRSTIEEFTTATIDTGSKEILSLLSKDLWVKSAGNAPVHMEMRIEPQRQGIHIRAAEIRFATGQSVCSITECVV